MNDIVSIHSLITQFNSDLAEDLLPPNVARRMVNVRPDTAGDTGFIQNIKGNVEKPNEDLPSGTNSVIGWTKYYKEKSIIYFIHNSLGKHSIWQYNTRTEAITRILQQDYPTQYHWATNLSFSLDYPITHANVIGDTLFWVDGLNYPGKIDLTQSRTISLPIDRYYEIGDGGNTFTVAVFKNTNILDYFNSGVNQIEIFGCSNPDLNGVWEIEDILIDRITFQSNWDGVTSPVTTGSAINIFITIAIEDIINYNIPPLSPVVYFGTDREIDQNNIRGKTFQFAVRHVYSDNTVSVFSPYSSSPIPFFDFTYAGDVARIRSRGNYINVVVPLGRIDVAVVEVYVREGNYGSWGLVTSLDKKEMGLELQYEYEYRFYNNVSLAPIDQREAARLMDLIPDAASAQEFVDDKYLIYGHCLDGRDNISIDVNLELERVGIPPSNQIAIPSGESAFDYDVTDWTPHHSYGWYFWVLDIMIPDVGTDGREDGDVMYLMVGSLSVSLVLNLDMILNKSTLINALVSRLNFYLVDLKIQAVAMTGSVGLMDTSGRIDRYSVSLSLYKAEDVENDANLMNVFPLPKMGTTYKFGLIYYDELLRPHTLQRNDDCYISIPYYTDKVSTAEYNYGFRIKWNIRHRPPDWAVAYKWAFASNSPLNYVQYIVGNDGVENLIGENYTLIDLEPLMRLTDPSYSSLVDKNFNFPNSIVSYQYHIGDRIRFITEEYSDESGDPFPPPVISVGSQGGTLDLEVLGFYVDEEGLDTNKLMVQQFNSDTYNIGVGSLFEIYRPKSESVEDVYFELPEMYPIEEDGDGQRYHSSPGVEEGYSFIPSVGTLYGGGIVFHVDTENESIFIMNTGTPSSPLTWSQATAQADIASIGGHSDWRLPTVSELQAIQMNIYLSYNNLANLAPGEHWTSEESGGSAYVSRMDVYNSILQDKTTPALYRVVREVKIGEALGVFTKLDNFVIYRAMSQKFQFDSIAAANELWSVESKHFSDFYKSDTYDLGRLNIYDPKAKRAWRNIIRRSMQYFFESRINGLSSFEYTNFEVFSNHFGAITGLAQIGFTLSVIQEHKITSVYIGRAGLYQAEQEGREVVVATDAVFGTSYRSEDEYGCQHPESILKVARYLYYFDRTNQAIIRKAANGNIDIAKYGVKKDIIALSEKLLEYDRDEAKVVGGYDAVNDEVLFSFIFGKDNPESHTFVFAENPALGEDANRWKAIYTLDNGVGKGVEGFCDFGSTLVAFMDGEVWLQNANEQRLNLFGIPREALIEIIVNKEMLANKIFRSIAIVSNDWWELPEYDDIVIPSTDLDRIAAKSRLVRGAFKLDTDGKRWAAFKKNATTTSLTPNQKDLITGKDLQGRIMRLVLRNDSSEAVYLKSVIINCQNQR